MKKVQLGAILAFLMFSEGSEAHIKVNRKTNLQKEPCCEVIVSH